MKRDLDFYEFTGIVLPGMMALLFVLYADVRPRQFLLGEKAGLGEFGILILLSYACGHLVQAFSNIWEPLFWRLQGGFPTDSALVPGATTLSQPQVDLLTQKVKSVLSLDFRDDVSKMSTRNRKAIARQLYAAVQAAGRSARLDTFNGNYGLLRGLASSLVFILALEISTPSLRNLRLTCWCAGLACLSLYRMRRFGFHYARELLVQFIQLPDPPDKASPSDEKTK